MNLKIIPLALLAVLVVSGCVGAKYETQWIALFPAKGYHPILHEVTFNNELETREQFCSGYGGQGWVCELTPFNLRGGESECHCYPHENKCTARLTAIKVLENETCGVGMSDTSLHRTYIPCTELLHTKWLVVNTTKKFEVASIDWENCKGADHIYFDVELERIG